MMSSPQERRPVVLSLIPVGSPEFPRYCIADQYLRYWTGDGWTDPEDVRKAFLYASANLACEEMQRILMIEHVDQPVRKFQAPIYIDLYSDGEISFEDVKAWLIRVSKLLIDAPKHGNGPMSGSLGLCRVEWGEMKEIK